MFLFSFILEKIIDDLKAKLAFCSIAGFGNEPTKLLPLTH